MRSLPDSIKATKGRLADSSLEDWPSFLENSLTAETSRPSVESQPGPIGLRSLHRRALAVVFISWIVFVVALVCGFILLTSLAIPVRASNASLTAVSLSESDLDIWAARRLYCFPSQPCDAWSPFSEDAPSNLRFEIQLEDPELIAI